jgi:peptidoglycan/LPS O-acetylase OafA/YrhL
MNRTKYRPDIDGLRAIAVVLVLGFHAFPQVVPGGFVGVDVFFVISGFLITSIISTGNFSFSGFYARRVRRLFPALALVLASSIVLGWVYLTPGQFEGLGNQALATALFVPNLLFWSEAGYFDSSALIPTARNCDSLGIPKSVKL